METSSQHSSKKSSSRGMLSMVLDNKALLYSSYMPFLNNGGIFIPTSKKIFKVGDEVFVQLKLEKDEKLPIAGRVVWVTPTGSQDSRRAGVGIHFNYDDKSREIRQKIERILIGSINSTRQTHTL